MDNLNNIPTSGNWGDAASKLNDNFNKVKQAVTTVENASKNNKGYFSSLSALNTAFPSPRTGQTAYVYDNATSNYIIYNAVNGLWATQSVPAPPIGVAVNDYAKHGGSSKTLKQVDDEIVQLAGEVASSVKKENVQYDSTGKNLAYKSGVIADRLVDSAGGILNYPNCKIIKIPGITPGMTYTISGMIPAANKYFIWKTLEGESIGTIAIIDSIPKTLVAPTGASEAVFTIKVPTESDDSGFQYLQFEEGGTATGYEEPLVYVSAIDEMRVLTPIDPTVTGIQAEIGEIADMVNPEGVTYLLPRNKAGEEASMPGASGSMYGFSDTYFNSSNLDKILIQARASGNYNIEFRAGSNLELIHTYNGTASGAGLIEIPVGSLGLPDITAYEKIYPFVGNLQDATPNVFMFSFNNPVAREWWMVQGAGLPVTYNTNASFNFWLELKKEYLIVQEVKTLKSRVQTMSEVETVYNYKDNLPVLPSQIFLRSDKSVFLYKKSLLSSIKNAIEFGVLLSSNTDTRKVIDIQEPSALAFNTIDNPAKFIVQQATEFTKLVYKDVQVFKKDVSDLSGKTVKIMSLGDSLTEGLSWESTPVCMLADALESIGVTTQFIGTLARNFTNRQGQTVKLNYEGRGGWRYRTLVGLESQFVGLNQIIPVDQTKSEWMLGVDGSTMTEIKANNPFLYPATMEDLNNYPEWCFHFVEGNTVYNKNYAEDDTLGTYHIFDPERYFSLRNIEIPDIITIALGTNEWYVPYYGGFDLAKATACFNFIISRFRQALPNTKIVVIPAQTMMIGRDDVWKEQYSLLCSNVMKITEQKITEGDGNLFICPVYAQGSRSLAFNNTIGTADNISDYNSTKETEVSQDVHYLYVEDESNSDYKEALTACIVNLID